MEVNPLSIILVKSDSKGDRLLFRYPFHRQQKCERASKRRKNPYTLQNVEDLLQALPQPNTNVYKGYLTGFTDEVLSSLFAVKPELCNKKFELKVNDVRFVGHPTILQQKQDESGGLLINVVFALRAVATHSVVTCYHDLSKRMGILLRHEERRCGYINDEIQTMMAAHDDLSQEMAFQTILEKSILAKNIKKMYEDLCNTGLVNVRINKWIPLSFCLPQKVHQWHLRGKLIEPDDIDRCINALRPYHSLLLLCPTPLMSDFISLDGSPSLSRMLSQYTPLKNLLTLAADADLTLSHVFDLTAHLIYWAKATVIYPICSTNKYVIAPDTPLHINSPLVDKFSDTFPGMNLMRVISEFSLPTSLGQKSNPLYLVNQQTTLIEMIIWMLQNHLLVQLHTYIQYMATDHLSPTPTEFESPINYTSTTKAIAINHMGHPTKSRTESESGTSTISEGFDSKNDSDKHPENQSYNSVEEDKPDYQEELLLDFPDEERNIIFKASLSNNADDLKLFARLCRKKYFQGNKHIEEIMYLENLRRSQLLQLLDKFREVLITYDTEDPTIAMFSSH